MKTHFNPRQADNCYVDVARGEDDEITGVELTFLVLKENIKNLKGYYRNLAEEVINNEKE